MMIEYSEMLEKKMEAANTKEAIAFIFERINNNRLGPDDLISIQDFENLNSSHQNLIMVDLHNLINNWEDPKQYEHAPINKTVDPARSKFKGEPLIVI